MCVSSSKSIPRLFSALLLAAIPSLPAATQPAVSLELFVPPAKTYVIGDQIELQWTFRNHTPEQLAFMWEGCCRVNGRVDMKRQGPPVPSPSGVRPSHVGFGPGIYNASCQHCRMERQKTELTVPATSQGPATAHMFARAARLPAKGVQSFKTDLANWVLLESTGDYKLSGGYLGVHPKQRPQMPKGAKLWDGITSSPAIELSLLTVADYGTERAARQRARGLQLDLSAPERAIPASRTDLGIEIINKTATNQTLIWPGEAALWVMDTTGRRLPDSRYAISDYGSPILLKPNVATSVRLSLAEDFFAGKPFGLYDVFVELKASTNAIRTPSNSAKVRWTLDQEDVRKLILDAADRPAVGHRNPPLKLLRMHLGEIATNLQMLNTNKFSGQAVKLAFDLRTASLLKPIQSRPGTANLNLRINADGSASFQEPAIRKALDARDTVTQLREIIALRRHLGWMIAINLRIDRSANLSAIQHWITELHAVRSSLTKAPRTRAFNATATAYSEITFAAPGSPPAKDQATVSGDLRWEDFLKREAGRIDSGKAFELAIKP